MIEKLKRLLLQKPFVPFEIILKDGQRLDVIRFGQVAVGLTKFTYVFPDQQGHVNSDESQIVALDFKGPQRATA